MKVFLLVLLILANTMAFAKVAPHKEKKKSLSTNVNFDDRLVGGKYQYSTEAITKVENDKSLDDLIGVRKNFEDRLNRSETLR